MSMFYELMMKKKGMPSRYQEVEYIESDGTQYIDTGLVPKVTFKYKIKYSLNTTGNQVLFGSRTSGAFDTSRNQIYFNANNNAEGGAKTYLLNIFNVNNVDLGIVPTQNVIVETPIMQNENCIIENATQPIYLFALNNKGVVAVSVKAKMYYYQIYDNSSLIRNFIPVYDTLTNKYGMWESVQGKFYGNDGTGDFKGSIVGYTIVGSPTITDGVVSGFSSSNYLTANNILSTTVGNKYVFEGEVSLSSISSSTQYIFSFFCNSQANSNVFGFAFRRTGKFMVVTFGESVTEGTLSYQTDTTYKYKVETDLNTYVRVYINGDLDISISLSYTNIRPYNGTVYYGCFAYNNTLPLATGLMNIENSLIKVNNKLYFNGQQS